VKRDDLVIAHDRVDSGLLTNANNNSKASNAALASLCDSKYTRHKRKHDLNEGNNIVSKVLTIDEDVKKSNSQHKIDDIDSNATKDSNAGFVLYDI